ncbi:hypothetical protein J4730_23180 [Klebsiella pneumoniae]|uniref:Uncharacterized protein n=1 Tax=Klebsiella pneumoniae TaxID=573 RepID=A0A939SU88_KLEPN|nr:hypothetical protein [Klebsiella pneumoniae]
MLVAALALSAPSPPAPRRPFLITPNSKPSNLRRKKNDAASAKQTQESRQSADNKNRYQHFTITKESPASRRRLHKDKLIQQLKTACRYAANGYCRSE